MISAPCRDSAGELEPLALACTPQVDAGEEHGQLHRLQFDAVLDAGRGIWKEPVSSRLYQMARPSRSK